MPKRRRDRGPPSSAVADPSHREGIDAATVRALLEAAVALATAAGASRDTLATVLATVGDAARASAPEHAPAETSREALLAAQRLIQAWATEPEFLDASGTPRRLALSGRGASFAALVRHTGGFARPAAALEVLERHAVVRREKGRVQLLSRTILMNARSRETWEWSLTAGTAALKTLTGNLTQGPDSAQPKRFERMVNSDRFPRTQRDALRRLFTPHADEFLKFLDQQFKNFEEGEAGDSASDAVGLWVVELDLPTPNDSTTPPTTPNKAPPRRR